MPYKVKSTSYSVLLKYPDGVTVWSKVKNLEEIEALRKSGIQVIRMEKLLDDFDQNFEGVE
jgi:hypothetical protein